MSKKPSKKIQLMHPEEKPYHPIFDVDEYKSKEIQGNKELVGSLDILAKRLQEEKKMSPTISEEFDEDPVVNNDKVLYDLESGLEQSKYDSEVKIPNQENKIFYSSIERMDFEGGFAMPKTRTKTSTRKNLLKIVAFLGGGVGLILGTSNIADGNFIRGISELGVSSAAVYYSMKSIFSNY